MIYIASPYTHASSQVRQARFEAVARFCGDLVTRGVVAFSPIVHYHPIAQLCDLPGSWSFWEPFCLAHLVRADSVLVLKLEDWNHSRGVREEINRGRLLNKRIDYAEDPDA